MGTNYGKENWQMKRNIAQYTDTYLQAPFLKENVEYRRRCVLRQMDKYPHSNILEIGCGMWPLFPYIEKYEKYYICEPSEIFVANAKKIVADMETSNVMVYQGCIEEVYRLWEGKLKFDFIVCSSLLHEVIDPDLLLEAIYNIADKDTVIHINVPNAMSIHRLLAKEMGIINNIYEKSDTQQKLQQREVYDIERLKTRLERSKFCILNEGSFFIKPFTHSQMEMLRRMNILNEEMLMGFDKLVKYFPENGSEIFVNVKKI